MANLAFTVLLLAAVVHAAPRCDLTLIKDCADAYKSGSRVSGVHTIYPSVVPVQAYCEMDADKGKWTVIQKRMDGTVNFYRPWSHYKAGFGNAKGEYWLGLESIHLLTNGRQHELRVDMEDFEGNKQFSLYSIFSVGSESTGYVLTVSGFKGGAGGDSLFYHNGQRFTTFDKDQDGWSGNCAVTYCGAFWYNACHYVNVNGEYLWGATSHFAIGVNWYTFKGYHYSLKSISMKIRPVS